MPAGRIRWIRVGDWPALRRERLLAGTSGALTFEKSLANLAIDIHQDVDFFASRAARRSAVWRSMKFDRPRRLRRTGSGTVQSASH